MRLLRQAIPRYLSALCSLALAAMLTGCGSTPPPKSTAHSPDERQDPLRIGDQIRVELSGISDLVPPSIQNIKEDGSINLSYVGRIPAAGVSPSQLEKNITDKYVPAYYPHITVTVTPTARFVFVGGQVNNNAGGRILYTGPMTVLGAIETAGDFTPFADRKHVQITRGLDKKVEYENCVKALKHPELDLPVYPGDMIQVGRRF